MSEARNLANLPGRAEGQPFHYLQSLGELIEAKQLVSTALNLGYPGRHLTEDK